MANNQTVAQPSSEGSSNCRCCDPISEQVRKKWQVGLPLWRHYNFIYCEPCGRIWKRISKDTSHWREIFGACPQKLRQRKDARIQVFGNWKPKELEPTMPHEVSDDKVVQFPHYVAA